MCSENKSNAPALSASLQRERSEVINALRFPMALGVVFLHAGLLSDVISQKVENGQWAFLKGFQAVIGMLSDLAVPLFFIISGYLFFKGLEDDWQWDAYKKKLSKRVRTLLIPYLIWNAISIVGWVQNIYRLGEPLNEYFGGFTPLGIARLFWQAGVHHEEQLNILGMNCVLDYPALVPFWFIRDLMVMMVLAPLFFFLIKRLGGFLPLLLGICYVLGIRLNVQGFSTVAFFFFSFGAWVSLSRKDFTNIAINSLRFLLPCVFLLFVGAVIAKYMDVESRRLWQSLFIVPGCVVAVGLCTFLQRIGKVSVLLALSSSSFFIFAAHALEYIGALGWSRKFLLTTFGLPTSEVAALIMYVANPLLATALCVIAYKLLVRFLPRIASVLCGGR